MRLPAPPAQRGPGAADSARGHTDATDAECHRIRLLARRSAAQVGNYGEVYARTLEPIGLTRGGSLNALWTDGGLIDAPPGR